MVGKEALIYFGRMLPILAILFIIFNLAVAVLTEDCSEGCTKCASPTSCTGCYSGHYLNDGYCNKCSDGCRKCASPTSCTWCYSGYYLNDGYCNKCSDNCFMCTSPTSCTGCYSGYYLNDGYCNKCSDGCRECASPTFCTGCDIGFYLNDDYCNKCNEGCYMCTSPTSCTACYSGYYLNNSYCNKCSDGCKECTSPSSCTKCQYGYYLKTIADGSVVCFPCEQSQCTTKVPLTLTSEKSSNGYVASESIIGIAVGAVCIGLGIVSAIITKILYRTRHPVTETTNNVERTQAETTPTAYYINVPIMDNINETEAEPSVYVSLTNRVEESPYSASNAVS